MSKITIFGKEFNVVEQRSEVDSIQQLGNVLLVKNHKKQSQAQLKEYLTQMIHNQLFKIWDHIKNEGKVDVIGKLDFEIVESIDDKKKRVAKLVGNRILVKINAVALPEIALRYVIAHEIAHTFTKRHTEKFWKIVESIDPNYKEAQSRLLAYQETLSNPLGCVRACMVNMESSASR